MFGKILAVEWMKLRHSNNWTLVLVGPVFAVLTGAVGFKRFQAALEQEGGSMWLMLFSQMSVMYAMLFLPLLAGVFAALVCRFEHLNGGWKQLLALPVSKSQVYWAKLTMVALLLLAMQGLLVLFFFAAGQVLALDGAVPWQEVLTAAFKGWIAALPIAALQLWASVGWKSFAAPLALNVILTIPGILIANSATYGPWYPWSQPVLAMLFNGGDGMPAQMISGVVVAGFVLAALGGWQHFIRRDVV